MMVKSKKTPRVADIEDMRVAANKVSALLKYLAKQVKPGVSLFELDKMAWDHMQFLNVESIDKDYKPEWANKPFPAYICTSVNNCIAHGIPTEYKLKEGDIINIDTGIRTKAGVCGDSALTVPVGEIKQKFKDLIKYANRTCYEAIRQIRPGAKVSDIGRETMNYAMSVGYTTNWTLSGHGIGLEMHEKPLIPHHYTETKEFVDHQMVDFGARYKELFDGVTLKVGQVVCVEPMINAGKDRFGFRHKDGWSQLTLSGARSAMFEHMVLVVPDGYEILTSHFEEV